MHHCSCSNYLPSWLPPPKCLFDLTYMAWGLSSFRPWAKKLGAYPNLNFVQCQLNVITSCIKNYGILVINRIKSSRWKICNHPLINTWMVLYVIIDNQGPATMFPFLALPISNNVKELQHYTSVDVYPSCLLPPSPAAAPHPVPKRDSTCQTRCRVDQCFMFFAIHKWKYKNSNMPLLVYVCLSLAGHLGLMILVLTTVHRLEYVVGCKRVGFLDLQNNSEG
jgi:hypothetical protein